MYHCKAISNKKKMDVYKLIQDKKAQGKKQLAVLIDPDKTNDKTIARIAELSAESGVD